MDERRLRDRRHRAAGSVGRSRLLANLEILKEGGAEAIWLSRSAGGGLPLCVRVGVCGSSWADAAASPGPRGANRRAWVVVSCAARSGVRA